MFKTKEAKRESEVVTMPVALRDLLEGKVEPALRPDQRPAQVCTFLREHADEAFTAAELAREFGTDHRTLRSVLARLHGRGLVDKKGDYWFTLTDEAAAAKRAFLRHAQSLDEKHGREDKRDWPTIEQPED